MSENIQETKKTQAEEQEEQENQEEQDSDGSSRSPGVTDRGLLEVKKSSERAATEQPTRKIES
ncbi:hypothetical protein RIVM261_071500 [Rivularia sp. IAM M-261]|nr:hypothetical protein CAL7716_019440 [Calothrix sp. PCC 7716]GJD22194.1 hypothetical protein RIVM261_071500 [Rivularia sp. IAM M-261]